MTGWSASFIGSPDFAPERTDNPAAYLRRDFTVEDVSSAKLHVTALGLVEPWLNGARVGDEVLAPGWTSYDHRLAVSTWDVTNLLEDGPNVVGAILGEGWAVGRVGWEGRQRVWSDHPSAFVQLDIEDASGTWSIGSDGTWQAGRGGVLSNSLFDGEEYDARCDDRGWCTTDFDGDWQPAGVIDRDFTALVPRTWEPVRVTQVLPAVEILRTPSGRTVVDFGQNLVGWVRLHVRGPAGTTITLRHAETLIAGEIDFTTNGSAAATDTYTLAGHADGETWEPRFTFHGFRYVELEGWPGDPEPENLTAVVVHSDMRRTGWFETSHPGLSQLHSNVVWSMRGNFVSIPTDCPQRAERAGWTGDINAFASTGAFLYDVRGVLESWLEDLAFEQRHAGSVPLVVPDVRTMPSPPTALWGDVAVNLPWVLYQEFGDEDVLRMQYSSMVAYVEQVEGQLDENGLWSRGYQLGDWLDPDAPPNNPAGGKTDVHLVAAAFFRRTTEQMARTADVLGKHADAARFARLDERVRRAFRREWVTPAGRLANETPTAYALAICFGLLDPEQLSYAGRRLADLVARGGFKVATGFAGTPFVAHALAQSGQLASAYKLVLNDQCPSFLYPPTMGATTIWERWDAIRPDGSLHPSGMTSLNHYALGAVADWLHRVVGGLTPAAPGYASIRVEPRPGGDVSDARTVKETPFGRASVSWHDADGMRTLEVTVPEGVEAMVVLPDHPAGLVESVSSGTHEWRYAPDVPVEPGFDLDTPLEVLRHTSTWSEILGVFHRHVPALAAAGDAFDLAMLGPTLGAILAMTELDPGIKPELIAVLERSDR